MRLSRSSVVVLLFLTLVNIVNFMDRTISLVVGEAIRRDLGLSDGQLGLLQGFAFAAVYCVVAIPLSRLSDRGFHRSVIAGSVLVWSVMTTLGGLAQSFWHLALMRIGVAAGEAGLTPASHSLISRLFTPERRGLAIGIFTLGLPLGIAAGAYLGGLIADSHGWRACFFIIGPIGLLFVPMAFAAVPKVDAARAQDDGLWAGTKLLFRNPAYRCLWMGAATASMFGYALATFFVPLFIRVHGMTAAQVGAIYGAINAVIGVLGIIAGGVLHDLVARRRPGRGLMPAAVALALSAPISLVGYMSSGPAAAMAAICVALLLYLLVGVPTYTLAQTIAPPELRATSSALMGFSNGLVGASGGPLVAGYLSDLLTPTFGTDSLRYSLASLAVFQLIGAWLFLRAMRHLSAETDGALGAVRAPAVP